MYLLNQYPDTNWCWSGKVDLEEVTGITGISYFSDSNTADIFFEFKNLKELVMTLFMVNINHDFVMEVTNL